ncbi:monocarboxylate transporter 12-like isoform X2 [Ostrea edulis]|uniref:monocarboxylate transporter 12-like isoform X2 n=1 Tax=Ostrea edulis TaxID=37623 RepID=UPI0024AF041D|nr:monocarboxylate transporter 12-like isoform X2 [Ostrea edulis]
MHKENNDLHDEEKLDSGHRRDDQDRTSKYDVPIDSGHQRDDQNETPKYDVPIDKGWAWVVLFSTFTMGLFVIGGVKSFGVLLVEFARVYNIPQSQITTIQSITSFFFLSLSTFSNWLCERFTYQKVIFVGGLFTSSGLILSFMAPSIEVMYITYGVLTGFGFGLTFPPSVVVNTRHFNKRRGLANGINMAGAALGGICMPILMQMLIDNYGLKGCMLILGGIMANICPCALLLRPVHKYPKLAPEEVELKKLDPNGCREKDLNEVHFLNDVIEITVPEDSSNMKVTSEHQSVKSGEVRMKLLDETESQNQSPFLSRRQTKTLENNSIKAGIAGLSTISLSCQSIPVALSTVEEHSLGTSHEKQATACSKFCGNLNLNLFKNFHFTMFVFSFFFLAYAYHSIFLILPSYGIEQGFTRHQSMSLIPAFGVADVVGRLIAGVINDKCVRWRKEIFIIYAVLYSLGYILTPLFYDYWYILFWCVSFGIFTGGYNGSFVIMIVDRVGMDLLPSAWGFLCVIVSIALLINPVLSGGLKDISGTWSTSILVAASFSLIACALLILEVIITRIQKRGTTGKKPQE